MNPRLVANPIRQMADVIQPFTRPVEPGPDANARGDGKAYLDGPEGTLALVWWGILAAVADLLEKQPCHISLAQVDYLRSRLCGGMGSFADFWIQSRNPGDAADVANRELGRLRSRLSQVLRDDGGADLPPLDLEP